MAKSLTYYVSYYEEYPIFEPAEGGYYYAGAQLSSSVQCSTLKKARQRLAKMVNGSWNDPICPLVQTSKNLASYHGNYIGEGSFLVIETHKGHNEAGYEPYC